MTPNHLISFLASVAVCLVGSSAAVTELRVATWNVGWHMDSALAKTWIDT